MEFEVVKGYSGFENGYDSYDCFGWLIIGYGILVTK